MTASDGSAVNWRMFGTLAALFPLGLAMTLSTVPISLTILVLLSPQRSRIAVPYLVGWVFGIAFFATVLTVGLLAAAPALEARERLLVPWAEIALGLALMGYAAVGLFRTPGRANEAPRWVRLIQGLKPGRAFLLGLALSLRPKSLLLTIAAGLVIISSPLEGVWVAVSLAGFTIVSSSSVVSIVLYALLRPSRADPALSALRSWLVLRGPVISRVIAVGTGLVLAGHGAWQL